LKKHSSALRQARNEQSRLAVIRPVEIGTGFYAVVLKIRYASV
jgi:hypothetical protein